MLFTCFRSICLTQDTEQSFNFFGPPYESRQTVDESVEPLMVCMIPQKNNAPETLNTALNPHDATKIRTSLCFACNRHLR